MHFCPKVFLLSRHVGHINVTHHGAACRLMLSTTLRKRPASAACAGQSGVSAKRLASTAARAGRPNAGATANSAPEMDLLAQRFVKKLRSLQSGKELKDRAVRNAMGKQIQHSSACSGAAGIFHPCNSVFHGLTGLFCVHGAFSCESDPKKQRSIKATKPSGCIFADGLPVSVAF